MANMNIIYLSQRQRQDKHGATQQR